MSGAGLLRGARLPSLEDLSIRQRLVLLVIALALPLNLIVVFAVLNLASNARERQNTNLLYSARAVLSAVDTLLQRHIALGAALAASPAVLEEDLSAFRSEAARAYPEVSEAWVLVADAEGRQLMNLLREPGQSLFVRNPQAIDAQRRAFAARSVQISDVFIGPARGDWIVSIETPIFRDGKPFRVAAILIDARAFWKLLALEKLPAGWLAGLVDRQGNFISRLPIHDQYVGKPASPGWRANRSTENIAEFSSLEGDMLINANTNSALSGWSVGLAVKKTDFEAPIWRTVQWAGLVALSLSLISLALAGRMARRITGPVRELERHAADVVAGRAVHLHNPTPEIRRVWAALEDAARERRRSEIALRAQEEQLRSAAEAAQFGAYTYDVAAERMRWSSELKRLFGAENIGENVDRNTADSFVHPEDRERKATVVREILSGVHERHQLEFRIVRGGDGAVRWVMDRGRAISDGGKVVRVVGVIIDISDLKAAEQRQKLLIDELNHRVKNTLAMAQSLATQTARAKRDPTEFTQAFSARLASLAGAHNLLTRGVWQGAALSDIVRNAVAPFQDAAGSIVVSGNEEIVLPASATITLSLMLHELATNAAKYGALAHSHGQVTVAWEATDVGDRRKVDLSWIEEGVSGMPKPHGKGFGTRLLEASMAQLDGELSLDYTANGLHCRMRFSVSVTEP